MKLGIWNYFVIFCKYRYCKYVASNKFCFKSM